MNKPSPIMIPALACDHRLYAELADALADVTGLVNGSAFCLLTHRGHFPSLEYSDETAAAARELLQKVKV
jgi:hypothetical protein